MTSILWKFLIFTNIFQSQNRATLIAASEAREIGSQNRLTYIRESSSRVIDLLSEEIEKTVNDPKSLENRAQFYTYKIGINCEDYFDLERIKEHFANKGYKVDLLRTPYFNYNYYFEATW